MQIISIFIQAAGGCDDETITALKVLQSQALSSDGEGSRYRSLEERVAVRSLQMIALQKRNGVPDRLQDTL